MTEEEKQALQKEAERQMEKHPGERVFSFVWRGQTFWLKKKQSNDRVRAAKYSVEKEFYYEVARISIAAQMTDCAPDMVLLQDSCFVLRNGGRTVQEWLMSEVPEQEKRNIAREAGRTLCRLHQAGLYHGRPALRDMVWNGRRLTLLDWENRTYFRDLPHRQMTDAVLLLQGMYREPWMKEAYVRAAWDGYREAGGAALLLRTVRFLRHHQAIAHLTGILHPFHFKDVEPLRKVYDWFESHEQELTEV